MVTVSKKKIWVFLFFIVLITNIYVYAFTCTVSMSACRCFDIDNYISIYLVHTIILFCLHNMWKNHENVLKL